jgi:hypothetical protein
MIAYNVANQIAQMLDEWDLDLTINSAIIEAEKQGWNFDEKDIEEFKDAVRDYIRSKAKDRSI